MLPIRHVPRCLSFILLSLMLVLTMACQKQVKEQAAATQSVAVAPAVVPSATPVPQQVVNPLVAIEQKLLREAQSAFRASRFTTPSHDNAYDKFQSVLLINPGNDQARAGLQAILLRYSGLIRNAIAEGRLSSAERYLKEVEIFYPANSLLMDLKKQIRTKRQRIAAEQPRVLDPPDLNAEEIPLSTSQLNARSPEVVDLLTGIANRLRQSDESVMIYARNDREGRWIYGQLKKAASGYRVRGDIRINRKPKIHILPPL